MEAWVIGDTAHGRGRLQVCDVHGSTALHWAAAVGDVNAVRYLLNLTGGQDIDIEASRHDGTTPLVRACIEGQEKIVELLVEEGALLECETTRGFTPLIAAVTRGWQEISIFLADSGALIEYRNHLRKTALSWANELLGPEHRVTIKLNDIADKQAAHRGLIQHITLDHFDEVYALVKDGVEHEFNALDTMRTALEKHKSLIIKAEGEIREYSSEITLLQPKLDAKVAAFGKKDQATIEDLEEAVVIEAEVEDLQSITDEYIKKALYNIRFEVSNPSAYPSDNTWTILLEKDIEVLFSFVAAGYVQGQASPLDLGKIGSVTSAAQHRAGCLLQAALLPAGALAFSLLSAFR
jgi:hypothetical protein